MIACTDCDNNGRIMNDEDGDREDRNRVVVRVVETMRTSSF